MGITTGNIKAFADVLPIYDGFIKVGIIALEIGAVSANEGEVFGDNDSTGK